jgi:hypothetical protein
MSRIQMACYGLIASAFVLTALIVTRVSVMADNKAYADLVVHKDIVTMLTTSYTTDADIVYVLDSKQERLLAYSMNPNRGTIELLPGGVLDVGKAFELHLRGGANPKAPTKKGLR